MPGLVVVVDAPGLVSHNSRVSLSMLYVLHASHVSSSRNPAMAPGGRKCSAWLLPPMAYECAATVMFHAFRATSRYRAVPVALYSRAAPIHLGTCVLACKPLRPSRLAASGSSTAAWSNRWATASHRPSPVWWYTSAMTSFMPPNSVPIMACICAYVSLPVRRSTHPAMPRSTSRALPSPMCRQTSSRPAMVLWMA
ncbi:hypothetical protein CTA2_11684 [Colletotrichum tanaceti]|nr:hypothetical protein CTA2_11684 [Colletotrichum tanaceti]